MLLIIKRKINYYIKAFSAFKQHLRTDHIIIIDKIKSKQKIQKLLYFSLIKVIELCTFNWIKKKINLSINN